MLKFLAKFLLLIVFMLMAFSVTGSAEDNGQVKKALLIIDIQDGWVKQYDGKAFEQFTINVNKVIDQASRENMTLIYIRQVGGGEICQSIHVRSTNITDKTVPTAFVMTKLNDFLTDNNIHELYVVGLDAAYCVLSTSQSAINLKYKVTIIKDAIITATGDLNELLNTYQDWGMTLKTSDEFSKGESE